MLWSLGAVETARMIATGEVSAREVAVATLDRIAAREPELNALSEVTANQALAAAEVVDANRAAGRPLGPLAGVPVTIKNNVDQAGTRNTGGLVASRDLVARQDSPLVANLRTAGAVIVGRSNVPAYSFRWFTDTVLHGSTRNPHRADQSAGGSSGGAGVAVAAGYGPLAHGNDIGGSIRQPALMNGVTGLRPTVGRIPSCTPSGGGRRSQTSQMFATEGPVSRNVEDAFLALNAMSTRSPQDPQHVPMPMVRKNGKPKLVGVMRDPAFDRMAPEVADAMVRAESALVDAGCTLQEIRLPDFRAAFDIWTQLLAHALRHESLSEIHDSGDAPLIRKVTNLLALAPDLDSAAVLDLWSERLQIQRRWSFQFKETPVILLPVSYRHGLDLGADQGDAAALQTLLEDQSPLLATAAMGHPALSVPTGMASDGLPTGVQLISRWWDEASLFAAGELIEAAMPAVTPV